MRFAVAATAIAAAAAVPLGLAANGAKMSPEQFLSEVRCVAYEDALGEGVPAAKNDLNWEALRQTEDTRAQAQAEVHKAQQAALTGERLACDARVASSVQTRS